MTREEMTVNVLSFLHDVLMYYNRTVSLPDCNTCKKGNCQYRPKPGEQTRINCPLWEGEKE